MFNTSGESKQTPNKKASTPQGFKRFFEKLQVPNWSKDNMMRVKGMLGNLESDSEKLTQSCGLFRLGEMRATNTYYIYICKSIRVDGINI